MPGLLPAPSPHPRTTGEDRREWNASDMMWQLRHGPAVVLQVGESADKTRCEGFLAILLIVNGDIHAVHSLPYHPRRGLTIPPELPYEDEAARNGNSPLLFPETQALCLFLQEVDCESRHLHF